MAYVNVKITGHLCFGYYLCKVLSFFNLDDKYMKRWPKMVIYKIYHDDRIHKVVTVQDIYDRIEREKQKKENN